MKTTGADGKEFGFSRAKFGGVVLLVLLLASGLLLVRSYVRSHAISAANRCIANLRQIEVAKRAWALENKKSEGDPVNVAGVCEFLKDAQLPKCPQHGVYSVNRVGVAPTCSLGASLGHTL